MVVLALPAALAAACLGGGPTLLSPDDAGTPPPTDFGDGAIPKSDVDLGDPFALIGAQPSHGPWTGGTRVVLSGRGFSSKLQVVVGTVTVPASDVFASDPTRAAMTTPPGAPGLADVTIVDTAAAQSRTLAGAYTYDAFDVTPPSGATTGGTRIALHGSGTNWASSTTVTVDGKPCGNVAVTDATHLECTTPPGSPGSKDVTVTLADMTQTQARDAFTYSDSDDGFRGGLSGGALSGKLLVLALDSYTGLPIPGATAIAGSDANTALLAKTDSSGAALITDASLTGAVTVTVAVHCHQPLTFVDVPVDTVTAYLDPVLDPACGTGDPPMGGGHTHDLGVATGELVWPAGIEFMTKGEWSGVPMPIGPNERRAAYVYAAGSSAEGQFYLPNPMTVTTMDSPGTYGYAYSLVAFPGNVTVYALAGIERTVGATRTFTPYVMGVQRGVPIEPNTQTTNVDIPMLSPLDRELSLSATPPATTSRGPDRLVSSVALNVGPSEFALFPFSPKTVGLPVSSNVNFIGLPALADGFTGSYYVVSSSAVSGPNLLPPLSVLSRTKTTDADVPLALTGFLPVPTLTSPGAGFWDGITVAVGATGTIDLLKVTVTSGGGLIAWTIVSPGKLSFAVPSLSTIDPALALSPGAIQTLVQIARIDGFSYSKLRSGQLGPNAWSAYAADVASGAL